MLSSEDDEVARDSVDTHLLLLLLLLLLLSHLILIPGDFWLGKYPIC